MINYDDFLKADVRVGVIVAIEDFDRARKPTYKIQVDFGEDIGLKWSSAQAKAVYTPHDLIGKQVIAVVNLPPKNIAGFMSEVLILGVPGADDEVALLMPSRPAKLGGRLY